MKRLSHIYIYVLLIIFLSVVFTINGCNPVSYLNEDKFYKGFGWFDHGRFPLIKPYEALHTNEEEGWTINLSPTSASISNLDLLAIYSVDFIAVNGGIISVYSSKPTPISSESEIKWFVIIPDEGVEIGFESEQSFLDYLSSFNVTTITWEKPANIAQKYYWSWCLDWIPACK